MHIQLMALMLLLFTVNGCAAYDGSYRGSGYERDYRQRYEPPRYPSYGVMPRQPIEVYRAPPVRVYRSAPPPPPAYAPGYYRPAPPPMPRWQSGPPRHYAPPPPPRHVQPPPGRYEQRGYDRSRHNGQRSWGTQRR